MRILLFEDDKQAAAYLVKGLDEAGFNVEHAPDGRDGLYLATSSHWIRGNRQLLAQGLANLVDNAIKYTPEGGRIGLRVWTSGGGTRLEV